MCRIWGESDGMKTVRLGIACVRAYFASLGAPVDGSEALARMAAVWAGDVAQKRSRIGCRTALLRPVCPAVA